MSMRYYSKPEVEQFTKLGYARQNGVYQKLGIRPQKRLHKGRVKAVITQQQLEKVLGHLGYQKAQINSRTGWIHESKLVYL